MTLPSASAVAPSLPVGKSGPTQAKATLRPPTFRAVMKDAILDHYGSLKCAAITLNVDASQLLKEWAKGNFLKFDDRADDEAKAFVSQRVHAVFGRIHDPKLLAKHFIREMRARLDELEQCVDQLL